jgi:hypothetical protein
MRCVWLAMPTLLAIISVASAQHYQYGSAESCRAPGPSCEAPPSAPLAPRAPEQPPAAPMYAAPPGMFQQPPATGAVYGPVERRDVEGAALTFPALTLRFPSLRLPAIAHSRSNARMEIDSASAPYIQQAPLAPYAVAAPMAAPPAAAPPAAPTQPQQAPPDVPAAPRMPGCDAPQGPYRAPSCDAYGKNGAVDEKLRSLEAAERRLTARIEELQQLAARLDSNATMSPLTPVSVGTAPAAYGPIRAPGEMPAQPVAFGAQRTSYIEPSPLPAEGRVVREPQVPAGRIIGLRGR